jgi:NAD(P)H-hydrate epimerase
VIPVVTPEEMRAVDAAAPEPAEVLIERAGAALARAALAMMGGAYGRRVVVVAGKGNNGADGRAAARRLARRGVRVTVLEASAAPRTLPPADLVVDAAYGTGFRGTYEAPDPGSAPVLAADIPSGVDGLTGGACPGAVRAAATVTFAALKPGLLQGEGPERAGRIRVADIGLDAAGAARAHLVELADVGAWLPDRPRDAHKYWAAVALVAGSPGMTGAALLAARGAMRSGAGYVRLAVPGVAPGSVPAGEHVAVPVPGSGWADEVLDGLDRRFKALVVGPGLGRGGDVAAEVRALVGRAPVPVVVDGDGLVALGERPAAPNAVLTPHDGEYARLAGEPPGPDRLAAARRLAAATGAVVLLKGPLTAVADPGGEVLLAAEGDARLATAGSGDVLAGVIGAFLAMGLAPARAAAAAAVVHGAAAHLGFSRGLVAGDLPDLLAAVLSALEEPQRTDAALDARPTGDDAPRPHVGVPTR